MRDLTKRLCRPGYDLQKEQAIQEAIIEIRELRAKIKAMEQQEPVAWLHETRRDSDVVTDAVKHVWGKAVVGSLAAYSIPLYLAPGAQPAPSISPVALHHVIQWLRNGCDPMKAADELEILTAAPEAKP